MLQNIKGVVPNTLLMNCLWDLVQLSADSQKYIDIGFGIVFRNIQQNLFHFEQWLTEAKV